jgi:hypothetical protein
MMKAAPDSAEIASCLVQGSLQAKAHRLIVVPALRTFRAGPNANPTQARK